MSEIFKDIAKELGELVTEKNLSYGDSARKVAEAMKIFYPAGVPAQDYEYSLLVVRILDKISRISQGHFKESFKDIGGYGIVGEGILQSKERPVSQLEHVTTSGGRVVTKLAGAPAHHHCLTCGNYCPSGNDCGTHYNGTQRFCNINCFNLLATGK